LWKNITHNKDLIFLESDITSFFNSINSVEDKKGCVLIQFPPSLSGVNIIALSDLLQKIKINNSKGWNIAVEFRNRSWYTQHTFDLLNEHNAALVIHDMPGSVPPMIDQKGNFVYLRFHGPTGRYRDSYSDAFLNEYAVYINEWLTENKQVYVYFNNTAGDAWNNLQTLNKLIVEQKN
jgi:uncharacterized protein YecE (DUF72 family)